MATDALTKYRSDEQSALRASAAAGTFPPKPPEWKGEFPAGTEYLPDGSVRVPAPDPIAEFNARRIAKRETPYWRSVPGLPMPDGLFDQPDPIPKCTHCGFTAPTWEASMEHAGPCGEKHRALASAMAINLHHTISDLIRPWRGK